MIGREVRGQTRACISNGSNGGCVGSVQERMLLKQALSRLGPLGLSSQLSQQQFISSQRFLPLLIRPGHVLAIRRVSWPRKSIDCRGTELVEMIDQRSKHRDHWLSVCPFLLAIDSVAAVNQKEWPIDGTLDCCQGAN